MKKTITAALSAAILLAPSVALAEEGDGQYFGAGAAQVKLLDWCDGGGGLTVDSCEDSEIGYQAFGGLRADPIGAELGVMFATGFDVNVSDGRASASLDADLLVLYGTVNGYLPLGDHFSLMGKAGVHWWDLSATIVGPGAIAFPSDDGIHALFGAGAEFKPTDNFALRAEWTRFLTSESDFDAPSVNLVVTF